MKFYTNSTSTIFINKRKDLKCLTDIQLRDSDGTKINYGTKVIPQK